MSYEARGGERGPCALGGAPRRRQGEAAAHAAPHLPRGLYEGCARLRRREVGLEEEVEECRRALEVDEEERRRELKVERHPPADRDQLVERRQDEVEEQVFAGRGRLVIRTGVSPSRSAARTSSPSARPSASRSGSGATSSSPRRARTRATTARATSSTTASRSWSAPRSSRAARRTSRAARSCATSASRARSRCARGDGVFPG